MSRDRSRAAWAWVRVLALVWAIVPLLSAAAHELPAEVRVSAYLRVQEASVLLAVRVPMRAMQEVEWPLRGPGYLELSALEPRLREASALWLVDNLTFLQGGRVLPAPRVRTARISLAGDRSFATFEGAIAHLLHAPLLPPSTDLYWQDQWLDVLLEFDLPDRDAPLAIDARFARMGLKVRTSLAFQLPGHPERVLEWHANPGPVDLDPTWLATSGRFVVQGIEHILSGIDHLLFLLCLVLPFRHRIRALVTLVSAFTIAHSITLAIAALGLGPSALWFPPAIEAAIAASILWMAIENLFRPSLGLRFAMAFGFGMIHGFGFAFALQEQLQFAGRHLASALLAFNLGVEFGQLLVLLIAIPVLARLSRSLDARTLALLISALVGHAAWHWMVDRAGLLLRFPLPDLDASTGALLLQSLLVVLLVALALGAIWPVLRRWLEEAPDR